MRGVDGGYTGEEGRDLDSRARGMGGLQTSCGEENLLFGGDDDPRYAGRERTPPLSRDLCMIPASHPCAPCTSHLTVSWTDTQAPTLILLSHSSLIWQATS